jgi:hypothetical protein
MSQSNKNTDTDLVFTEGIPIDDDAVEATAFTDLDGTKQCPATNKAIFDAFINDLHESYFKPGDNQSEPDPNYSINKTHRIKIKSYPSSFSTEENPIHFYSKLTDNITYGNFWEQYVMDSWAIDDMFNLVNLQQYSQDPYKGDDNEDDKRKNCDNTDNDDVKKKDEEDEEYDAEKKKEIEKCKNYKQYKKYKQFSELKNNTIKEFEYNDNFKIQKINSSKKKNSSKQNNSTKKNKIIKK